MATDRAIMKQQEAGQLNTAGVSSPITAVAQAHSYTLSFSKASDDAMASTTTSETYTGLYVVYACRVKSVTYSATTGGITADNTNYATVTVSKRDSAAANLTTVATLTTTATSSGNITQGAGKALVLSTTAGALDLAIGATFTYSIAKAGSGVVVRAGTFTVELENM